MKHLSKISVAGALLFALSTTYAQSNTMPSGNPNSTTNTQQDATGSTTTTGSAQASSQTSQGAKGKGMPISITPDSIQWKDAPAMLPPGAQYAVLEGNPKSKGVITIRLRLPANYQIPAVSSQSAQRLTVLSGTINLGTGDKLDTTAGTPFPAGSFIVIPANKHHYLWSSDDAVVQISGAGPWTLKYVNAKDDPRKNKDAQSNHQAAQPGQTPDQSPSSSTMGQPNGGSTNTPASSQPSSNY